MPAASGFASALMCCRRVLSVIALLALCQCGGNDVPHYQSPTDATVIGYTTTALNINKDFVRSQEAPVGNLVADALTDRLPGKGFNVDIGLINGGNLRFDVATHPDGIIPVGELSQSDINNLLPFGNKVTVLELTGAELKSTLERSFAQLPSARPHGAFLQVSQILRVQVDLSRAPQILDNTVEPPRLLSEGERVRSVSIRGLVLDTRAHYLVALPDFVANGGDGYVALREVPAERRQNTDIVLLDLVVEYVKLYQPVSPQVEGRIIYLL